jgi:lactate racemase
MIGLGLHRKMTTNELRHLEGYQICQHDPDDVLPLEKSYHWKNGEIQGYVHRQVLEHELVISIGVAELHQYAGYSGGHKGIAIGCGGRQTISQLHHRDFILQDNIVVGKVHQNPFREAVDFFGEAANCQYALTWVPSLKQWIFGDPKTSIHYVAQSDQPWNLVERTYKNILCLIPSTKAKSLYQASRIATYIAFSPNPPLQERATFFIEASMEEGLGTESGFCAALASCPYPYTELLTEKPPTGAGAQRAVMIAKLAQKYDIQICGCVNPQPFWDVGLSATTKSYTPNQDVLVVDNQKSLSKIPQWRPV